MQYFIVLKKNYSQMGISRSTTVDIVNTMYSTWRVQVISVAARSKAWLCGRSLAGIAGSNPAEGMGVYLLRVFCVSGRVSVTGWSLVQRSPPECDVSNNPYPTAFPYGNGMVLHFYQQQESSTTKTVHKVINKGLKAHWWEFSLTFRYRASCI